MSCLHLQGQKTAWRHNLADNNAHSQRIQVPHNYLTEYFQYKLQFEIRSRHLKMNSSWPIYYTSSQHYSTWVEKFSCKGERTALFSRSTCYKAPCRQVPQLSVWTACPCATQCQHPASENRRSDRWQLNNLTPVWPNIRTGQKSKWDKSISNSGS
jgi:hypothetical protein